MTRDLKQRIALLLLALMTAAACYAQHDPIWLGHSEKKLNSGVGNDTYSIHVLKGHSPSEKMIGVQRDHALQNYMCENFGAIDTSVRVDSVSGGDQPVYWVYFNTDDSENNFVAVKLIDQYTKFTDFELNVYLYEFYYLMAMSAVNTYPQFDEFINYTPSNGKALALSVIPGLGQLYKGQTTKGYVILGSEIFFAGAAVYFETQRVHCHNMIGKTNDISDSWNWGSWRSKANGWRNFRNGALGLFAGVYIYNLIDAATSKGCSNFKIKKVMHDHVVMAPFVAPDFTGFTMQVTF